MKINKNSSRKTMKSRIMILFLLFLIIGLNISCRTFLKDEIKAFNKYYIKNKAAALENDIDSFVREMYSSDLPDFIVKKNKNIEYIDYICYKKLDNAYATNLFKSFDLIAIENHTKYEECKYISFVMYPYLDLLFLDGYQYGFYYTEEDIPINIFMNEELQETESIYQRFGFGDFYGEYKTEKITDNLWYFETRDLTKDEYNLLEMEREYSNFLSQRSSYDKKYTMKIDLDEFYDMEFIKVILVENMTQKEFFSITNEYRAFDFNGIIWEDKSYDFWIKSSDLGIYCYKYTGNNSWEKYSLRNRNDSFYLYKEGHEIEIKKEEIPKKEQFH